MVILSIRPNRPTRTTFIGKGTDKRSFILRAGDTWQLTAAEAEALQAWAARNGIADDYVFKAQAAPVRAPEESAAPETSGRPARAPRAAPAVG